MDEWFIGSFFMLGPEAYIYPKEAGSEGNLGFNEKLWRNETVLPFTST